MRGAPAILYHLQERFTRSLSLPLEQQALEMSPHIKKLGRFSSEKKMNLYASAFLQKKLLIISSNFHVTHEFLGKERFNQEIAIPYIRQELNFTSQSLRDRASFKTGMSLIQWFDAHYQGQDKNHISLLLEIDQIQQQCLRRQRISRFIVPDNTDELLLKPCTLQPFVKLLESNINVFNLTEISNCDLSEIFSSDKKYYYVIYRQKLDCVIWESVHQKQFVMMQYLQKESSLKEAFDCLCKKFSIESSSEVLPWIYFWIQQGWLGDYT